MVFLTFMTILFSVWFVIFAMIGYVTGDYPFGTYSIFYRYGLYRKSLYTPSALILLETLEKHRSEALLNFNRRFGDVTEVVINFPPMKVHLSADYYGERRYMGNVTVWDVIGNPKKIGTHFNSTDEKLLKEFFRSIVSDSEIQKKIRVPSQEILDVVKRGD
jgi:hypothetical protein